MDIKLTDEQKRFLAQGTFEEIVNFYSVPENQEKFEKWIGGKSGDAERTATD